MTNKNYKKNVMLTITEDEAKKLASFAEQYPYISLAKLIKQVLLEEISKMMAVSKPDATQDELL